MIRRWLLGIVVGTTLIAITSPCFVRSYLPRVVQPDRGVVTLHPNRWYRWRSEGYATSEIGPLGMVGNTTWNSSDASIPTIALWGDSQAEGVCVADEYKIAGLTEKLTSRQVAVLPFARSGDDCNDWIQQIENLKSDSSRVVAIDAHVFLITEWSDWCIEIETILEEVSLSSNRLSEIAPAFLIQVGRNILTQGMDDRLRTLRFLPGPVKRQGSQDNSAAQAEFSQRVGKISRQLERLQTLGNTACVFVYAPLYPAIVDGRIEEQDPDNELFDQFVRVADQLGFHIVDLRPALVESVSQGIWPRGFHNGQFGVGHFNAQGNEIIAKAIVDVTANLLVEN